MHKIQLRDKRSEDQKNGQPTVGANCEVLIDGVPLKYITNFKVEIDPRNVAKVTIEMLGDIDIDILGSYECKFFSIKEKGVNNVDK